MSDASVILPDEKTKTGLVIDIDTIKNTDYTLKDFNNGLDAYLDEIHLASKMLFFTCLSQSALDLLEPQYE